MEIRPARFGRYATGLDGDCWVTSIEQPQHRNEVRLRLNRHHMGTDLAENAYPIAYVGTDVESQVTGLKELPVKSIHPAPAPHRAVVDDHRTSDPERAPDHVS